MDETFYMSAPQAADLARAEIGGWKLVLEWADDRRRFTIRDSFDQRLRLSQRLLLEESDCVALVSASGGALIRSLGQKARPA